MERRVLPFAKMHGCGNDYVVVDALRRELPDLGALARAITDRRRGVGADGLILAVSSERADVRMRMLNPDGSEAEMCGNGLRCLARFLTTRLILRPEAPLRVATGAGLLEVSVDPDDPGRGPIAIDMGRPRLQRSEIPMDGAEGRVLSEPMPLSRGVVEVTAVSMGNPHAVVFVDDVESAAVETLGPEIERHAAFPRRTNVAFVEVVSAHRLRQRTWERGCGETAACGTGACAAVVAGALTDRIAREATVHLRGGDLEVRWAADDHVFLRGPAVEVYEGLWPLE